jgi:hypothetical protein
MTRHRDSQGEESRLRYGHNLDEGRFSTIEPDYDAEHRRDRNEKTRERERYPVGNRYPQDSGYRGLYGDNYGRRAPRRKGSEAEDIKGYSGDESEGEVDNGRDAGTDDVNRFSSHNDPSVAGPPGRDDYK